MFHKKIDKLQFEVNELLDLCGETGAIPEESPSEDNTKYLRLGEMILKAQDGELEQRTLLRMEKWLMCDEQALRYYVDFQNLSVLLYEHFHKSRFAKILDFFKEFIGVGSA